MSAITKDLKIIYFDIHSDRCVQRWGKSRLHAIPAIGKQVAGTVLGIFGTAICGVSTIVKLPFQAIHLAWKTNPTLNNIIKKMPGVESFIGFAIASVLNAIGALNSFVLGTILCPSWNITVQCKLGFISDKKLAKFAQMVKDGIKTPPVKVKKPEKKEEEKEGIKVKESEGSEGIVKSAKKHVKGKKKEHKPKKGSKKEKGAKIEKLPKKGEDDLNIKGENEKAG